MPWQKFIVKRMKIYIDLKQLVLNTLNIILGELGSWETFCCLASLCHPPRNLHAKLQNSITKR